MRILLEIGRPGEVHVLGRNKKKRITLCGLDATSANTTNWVATCEKCAFRAKAISIGKLWKEVVRDCQYKQTNSKLCRHPEPTVCHAGDIHYQWCKIVQCPYITL